MKSRMGKATESQFACLAYSKHDEEPVKHFNVNRILNPALRAKRPAREQDKLDMLEA